MAFRWLSAGLPRGAPPLSWRSPPATVNVAPGRMESHFGDEWLDILRRGRRSGVHLHGRLGTVVFVCLRIGRITQPTLARWSQSTRKATLEWDGKLPSGFYDAPH
jgi:hypothetical protein